MPVGGNQLVFRGIDIERVEILGRLKRLISHCIGQRGIRLRQAGDILQGKGAQEILVLVDGDEAVLHGLDALVEIVAEIGQGIGVDGFHLCGDDLGGAAREEGELNQHRPTMQARHDRRIRTRRLSGRLITLPSSPMIGMCLAPSLQKLFIYKAI